MSFDEPYDGFQINWHASYKRLRPWCLWLNSLCCPWQRGKSYSAFSAIPHCPAISRLDISPGTRQTTHLICQIFWGVKANKVWGRKEGISSRKTRGQWPYRPAATNVKNYMVLNPYFKHISLTSDGQISIVTATWWFEQLSNVSNPSPHVFPISHSISQTPIMCDPLTFLLGRRFKSMWENNDFRNESGACARSRLAWAF